ncbi:MAG TPA: hypothetical protein VJ227_03605 [Patescibacteria group bacterium]|nr:hypothetical protein [Patescibacteria group bacterium]
MSGKVIKIIFFAFSLVLFAYLSLPNFDFPLPPSDSLTSDEPADSETPLRRAYFTDFTREEVLRWYEAQMKNSEFLGIPLPTFRLNYPPEEAQTIIRDQTRSTFLQEIVHPMRESVYINGFEPADPKDAVIIKGRHFRQKIIVRFVPSSFPVRLISFFGVILSSVILFKSYAKTFKHR